MSIVSRLLRATPPRVPPAGEGLMYASCRLDRVPILVLSPRMEPLVTELVGSTDSTATLCPLSHSILPKASIIVLLPAPGTPVIPIRRAFPVWGSSRCNTRCALTKCLELLLSMRVIALDNTMRSPFRTPSTYSSSLMISRRFGFILPLASIGLILPVVVSLTPSIPLMTLQANLSSFSSGTQLGFDVVYFAITHTSF